MLDWNPVVSMMRLKADIASMSRAMNINAGVPHSHSPASGSCETCETRFAVYVCDRIHLGELDPLYCELSTGVVTKAANDAVVRRGLNAASRNPYLTSVGITSSIFCFANKIKKGDR
jgi:hypothetical protein